MPQFSYPDPNQPTPEPEPQPKPVESNPPPGQPRQPDDEEDKECYSPLIACLNSKLQTATFTSRCTEYYYACRGAVRSGARRMGSKNERNEVRLLELQKG